MTPARTIEKLGVHNVAKLLRFKAHDAYAVDGVDLNDLCALAARLDYSEALSGDERRDWANRLNLIISDALKQNLSER